MPDALDLLLDRPQYADVADDAFAPGLDRMRALLDGMGTPHEALRAVHVAGTNGKGSTAAMTAAIATAAGLRTGLHTSPHLTHVAQRMRVDGTPPPPRTGSPTRWGSTARSSKTSGRASSSSPSRSPSATLPSRTWTWR